MFRWVGKLAVVTGASTGIGKATVVKFVDAGIDTVAVDLRNETLEELKESVVNKKGKIYNYVADVKNEDEIIRLFAWIKESLGPIHILVNNAGILKQAALTSTKTNIWRDVLNTNVLGLCIMTREAILDMRTNNVNGHIIHINSISGHRVVNLCNSNVYQASKHAVTALTETLKQELNRSGEKIKITSLSPGIVATDLFASSATNNLSGSLTHTLKNEPYLQSEDVAGAIMYALSTPPHVDIHELIIKPVGETL